jgi:hypothetical protein
LIPMLIRIAVRCVFTDGRPSRLSRNRRRYFLRHKNIGTPRTTRFGSEPIVAGPSPSGDLSEKVTDHQGDQRSSEWLLLHEVRQLVGLVCCRPGASPQRLTRRVKQSRVSLPRLTRRAGRHRSIIVHREIHCRLLSKQRGSSSQVPGRSAGQPTVTIPRSPGHDPSQPIEPMYSVDDMIL